MVLPADRQMKENVDEHDGTLASRSTNRKLRSRKGPSTSVNQKKDEEQEDEPVKASTKAQKRRVRKQDEVTRNKESTKAVSGEEKAASDLVTKPIAKKRRTTKARPASGSEEDDNNEPEKTAAKTQKKRSRKCIEVEKIKESMNDESDEEVPPDLIMKAIAKKRETTKLRSADRDVEMKVKQEHELLPGPSTCLGGAFGNSSGVEVGRSAPKTRPESGVGLVSSSGSEDEWEEMEEIEPVTQHTVEVTIKQPVQKESEEAKWEKFLRMEVNRKIKQLQVDCHKMHLLCYVAHLRTWARCLVENEHLSGQCLSLIPISYVDAAELTFDLTLAERFTQWFTSAFTLSKTVYDAKNGFCDAQSERLEKLIAEKTYETDRDRASILFLCVLALKQSVRLCLSCQPVPHKPTLQTLVRSMTLNKADEQPVASGISKREKGKGTSGGNKQKKVDRQVGDGTDKRGERKRASEDSQQKEADSFRKTPTAVLGRKATQKVHLKRDYWVEYWDELAEKWICMDPWKGTVGKVESFEDGATSPMHYVIAIDNDFGMRDVTALYASKYPGPAVRRLRIDDKWWDSSIGLFQGKNSHRTRLETVTINDFLLSKPMPTTVAEFKNHPLYVLKKDLLKFEAIYPPDQEPITTLRGGIEVYPRASVHHLQGSLNWLKQARSVKAGEKPYKVVKARPSTRVPPEEREPRTLEVYGYWQTEPYVPPEVVDGRIPRNEYGNIYMYRACMLPKGCVHLKLDGLYGLARRMDIECVPAVVAWDFHKGGNHPIIDGCVVLAKDAMLLKAAWEEQYERKRIKAAKARKERAKKNWKRLVKGVLRMKRIRAKFLGPDRRLVAADEQLESGGGLQEAEGETPIDDDMALAWPRTSFDLPTV
uniref:DNA repair protein complementing XP-C cells n=1 Tax=Ascaris lumbricoides TaxID=6252 RepID=A0A0M3HRB8_ASCLU